MFEKFQFSFSKQKNRINHWNILDNKMNSQQVRPNRVYKLPTCFTDFPEKIIEKVARKKIYLSPEKSGKEENLVKSRTSTRKSTPRDIIVAEGSV